MNKEEILSKSKKENQYLDEREQQEIRNGFGFGAVIVCVLCFLFTVIKVIKGEFFYEYGTIVMGYLASTSWYSFRSTSKKSYLIQAITCSLAAVVTAIAFFVLE